MDIFMIGQHKSRNKTIGFRIMQFDAMTGEKSIKDVNYNVLLEFIRTKRISVKNLKVDGTQLKGLNGSIDRYGVVGKSTAIVILYALQDKSGKLVGYWCSDTSGKVVRLTEADTITVVKKYGIANGKLIEDAENKKSYISAIEGTYDSVGMSTDKNEKTSEKASEKISEKTEKASEKIEKTSENIEKTSEKIEKTSEKTEKAEEKSEEDHKEVDGVPADVRSLIEKLKCMPNYADSFASKLVITIEKTNKCSEKQKALLEKEYNRLAGDAKIPQEVLDLINKAKSFKQFKGSKCESIINTVEKNKWCSDRQNYAIKVAIALWEKENEKAAEAEKDAEEERKREKEKLELEQKLQKEAEDARKRKEEQRKREEEYRKNLEEARKKREEELEAEKEAKRLNDIKLGKIVEVDNSNKVDTATLKHQQWLTKNDRSNLVQSDILEYEVIAANAREKHLYVVGFKSGVDTNIDLVIPDTVNISGKEYKVYGVAANAFKETLITSVVGGANLCDMGQGAFYKCKNLTHADFSSSKLKLVPMFAFYSCPYLESADVGEIVERIHESAFESCKKLVYFKIPKYCNEIARRAFAECHNLLSVTGSVKKILDSAFLCCYRLSSFDFSATESIATQAFKETGFNNLVIPGNVKFIGRQAFADCSSLDTVKIEEGVEVIDNYAFAKHEAGSRSFKKHYNTEILRAISRIDTCKSLKDVKPDAYKHAELVGVWTGSVSESVCISMQIPFIAYDSTDEENSTKVRRKSEITDSNPVEVLGQILTTPREGAGNPPLDLNVSKMKNIELTENLASALRIELTTNEIEPSALFKCAANYLMDVGKLFTMPISTNVLRFKNSVLVEPFELYNDSCNRIIKIKVSMLDTLENGEFILVIMNNIIKYITAVIPATDISFSKGRYEYRRTVEDYEEDHDLYLPLGSYLHKGDILGYDSNISGHAGVLNGVNVGLMLYEMIKANGFKCNITRKDSLIYVPSASKGLWLYDAKDRDTTNSNNNNSHSTTNYSILGVLSYEDFVNKMLETVKSTSDSEKFFNSLGTMSEKEARIRNIGISTVEEEKEAHLFKLSNDFRARLKHLGKNPGTETPNDLTPELFKELSISYYMVPKDKSWLKLAGSKSLNKKHVYKIGGLTVTEYQSNQIVKFSNPYMNGAKGAYIFTSGYNNRTDEVYASTLSLQDIVSRLVSLTLIDSNIKDFPVLMQDANKLDAVDPGLFAKFYDVLYTKTQWQVHKYIKSYYSRYDSIYNLAFSFALSMYKPTGIFYLVLNRVTIEDKKTADGDKIVRSLKTYPIFPIGNMDRALMVANTTNRTSYVANFLNEMLQLGVKEAMPGNRYMFSFDKPVDVTNYFKARQLAINGVKDASQYRALIDSRAVYMLGTVHKGKLQREHSWMVEDTIEDDEAYKDIISELEEDLIGDEDVDDLVDYESDDNIDIESDDEDYNQDAIIESIMADMEDEDGGEYDGEEYISEEDVEYSEDDEVMSDDDIEALRKALGL